MEGPDGHVRQPNDRRCGYRNNAEQKKNWDRASDISRTLERIASEPQREGEDLESLAYEISRGEGPQRSAHQKADSHQ